MQAFRKLVAIINCGIILCQILIMLSIDVYSNKITFCIIYIIHYCIDIDTDNSLYIINNSKQLSRNL